MNTMSRTITGIVAILLGLVLIGVAVFGGGWPVIFYGIPILIIGFVILFNNREDRIEGRKDMKGGKN